MQLDAGPWLISRDGELSLIRGFIPAGVFFCGSLLAFGISKIPRPRIQKLLYLILWLSVVAMYLIGFGRFASAPWAPLFSLAVLLPVGVVLASNLILIPYWLGQLYSTTSRPAYFLLTFAFLGVAAHPLLNDLSLDLYVGVVRLEQRARFAAPALAVLTAICAWKFQTTLAEESSNKTFSWKPNYRHYVIHHLRRRLLGFSMGLLWATHRSWANDRISSPFLSLHRRGASVGYAACGFAA